MAGRITQSGPSTPTSAEQGSRSRASRAPNARTRSAFRRVSAGQPQAEHGNGRATSRPACPARSRVAGGRIPATHTHGLTLVELLIAAGVAGIVMALILPIVLGNRRVVQNDQLRTGVNQTLRATNDILAADLRITGERFGIGLGISPIELRVNADGNSELVVRRNLVDALPVCAKVSGNQTIIQVAEWGSTLFAQCDVTGTTTDTGGHEWPETMYAHKELLDAAGGMSSAFIFDPVSGIGQWFPMSMDGTTVPQPDVVQCVPTGEDENECVWDPGADYSPGTGTGPYAYIAQIEESTYRVRDGILEKVDTGSGRILRIASGVNRFRVTATFAGGVTRDAVSGTATDWRDIRSLDLDMAVTLDEGRTQVERELQTSLFPRNLLSR